MNRFFRQLTKKKISHASKEDQVKNPKKITKDLASNIKIIKSQLGTSHDMIYREMTIGRERGHLGILIFINGLTRQNVLDFNVLKRVMYEDMHDQKHLMHYMKKNILTVADIKEVACVEDVIKAILMGKSVLLVDGFDSAFEMDTREWKDRDVKEPITGSVVRGPHEAFTETLLTNTALIRRRIKSTKLTFELMTVGQYTQTDIVIAYIKGIAKDRIIKEIKKRIKKICIDGIIDSGYIEQFIEDEPFSLFPTIGNTEKPDVTAAKLLEGRVAVIVDGSPIVLTIPYLFIENLQSSEDYYTRPWYASFLRGIRVLSLIIVIFLPGFYISAQTYNQEMLPTHLFITMAAAKEGVPFPAFVEIFIMSIFFEVFKEAGIRMPKYIGQAVSIVGALVLGEAVVEAGFVSNPAIMITALTGIATFVIYSLNDSITILRFTFMILGAVGGLFGILIGTIFLLIHVVSIKSFGAPYMSPLAPRSHEGLKDTLMRFPLWLIRDRPGIISNNKKRLNNKDKKNTSI